MPDNRLLVFGGESAHQLCGLHRRRDIGAVGVLSRRESGLFSSTPDSPSDRNVQGNIENK